MVNVGKYAIHRSYGIGFPLFLFQVDRQWSEVLAPMDVHFGGLEVSGFLFFRTVGFFFLRCFGGSVVF